MEGEAEFLVLFPAPVIRQARECPQALVTFRELALGFLLRPDIAHDAGNPDDRARSVAQ